MFASRLGFECTDSVANCMSRVCVIVRGLNAIDSTVGLCFVWREEFPTQAHDSLEHFSRAFETVVGTFEARLSSVSPATTVIPSSGVSGLLALEDGSANLQ